MTVSDERVDLASEQIDTRQQAERAMAFALVIPCKGGVKAGLGRQIRSRRRDGLDSGLLIIGEDGHPFDQLLRVGRGFFRTATSR